MSKDISTVPGKTYVVTLSQAGELTGVSEAGEPMVLASADSAGQVSFQAISTVTKCSDDGATVLPFSDAPLPIGVDGGASAKQVAAMVDSAICGFSPAELATPAGTANATCNYIELDARHVPQGRLQSISLRSRSGGNPPEASYLAAWELGEDGATWTYLGSSTNNPLQAMNQTKTWEFAEGEAELSGRKLRILAQAERSNAWAPGRQLGVYVSTPEEGDATKCYNNGTGYSFLPQMAIAVQQPVARFAPAEHVEDDVAHVAAAEHEWLAAAQGGSQALSAPALNMKGTQGNTLLTVRGNLTNVTVTGSALTCNVPKFWVTGDNPALYSYDANTGITKVWFAVTRDAASLAPLGLTEPGAYAGDASLPLCLRGSELRFNGAPISGISPSVGADSLAAGSSARAEGRESLAIGRNARTTGDYSTAIGNRASADNPQVMGSDSSFSTAVGHGAEAWDHYATAVGCSAKATGFSVAVGFGAQTALIGMNLPRYVTLIGYNTKAYGDGATAVGREAKAGKLSAALGPGASATEHALALGAGAACGAEGGAAIGRHALNGDPGTAALCVAADTTGNGLDGLERDGTNGGWIINNAAAAATVTQLYLIGAGSAMANAYTDGEAGLGFVEYEPGRSDGTAGRIVRRGCRKLSELLTSHADDFNPNLAPGAPAAQS